MHFSGASLPATQARLSARVVFCESVILVATYQQNGADPEQPGPAGIDAIVISPPRRWSEPRWGLIKQAICQRRIKGAPR
ncbi:hypothetical protein PCA10_36980 [Metapseudomonas resinovorans NBRC 106553]|uniref:Uncharacterized protein n=1 Tax=Metapseudomonas resinovorans NBRC 106553 TaxID=1245471 RepID=S6AL41_METRE|nr:hypothetical protein PCA10_36980 [Pseudomonas resinovorans NBRC 106553]